MRMMGALCVMVLALPACGEGTGDPFPRPIRTADFVVHVKDFAKVPNSNGQAARMNLIVPAGDGRLFLNDMRGPMYAMSPDGADVKLYLNLSDPRWRLKLVHQHPEQGFQNVAFHPQFNRPGTPGYGKFYTSHSDGDKSAHADFTSGVGKVSHHEVLLEWTAKDPAAAEYDGGVPRTLMRVEQPYANHNGGIVIFNPNAQEGDAEFGKLYYTLGDGGDAGDPHDLAEDPSNIYGSIIRIDPLGKNSANGQYGIPGDNPFVGDNTKCQEVYAYGFRHPQRICFDLGGDGAMFIADIGQGVVEEIDVGQPGGNYGWNRLEGSFAYIDGKTVGASMRGRIEGLIDPIAEFDQVDKLLQDLVAITCGYVYRRDDVPQLSGKLVFAELVSGEVMVIDADPDQRPDGWQDAVQRVQLDAGEGSTTMLELIRKTNPQAKRADVRFGHDADGRVFILNKHDGIVRVIVPAE